MSAETEPTTTETWLYAGQRLDGKDKPFEAWHDGHKIVHFTKLIGLAMAGSAYNVEVVRDGDSVRVRGVPRYAHEERTPTTKQLDEWRAEDKAARAILDGKRMEKQAVGDDELEQALEVLRRHYAAAKTIAKRGAFQSYVLGEMTRKPKERSTT